MAQRPCAACGKLLPEGTRRKTCNAKCRKRLQRMHNQETGWPEAQKEAARQARAVDAVELAKEVFRQELTPIVREQITEEVVQSIAALMKLTPALVESLANDLFSNDANTRTRAQAIVAKYTLGQADSTSKTPKLVVNLGNMPDPSQDGGMKAIPVQDVDHREVRICERCEEEKDIKEFDGAAPRCRLCQEEIRQGMEARFGG